DGRHLGIEVLPPDINLSRADFTPVGEVVRFGLYGIKNVGEGAVDHILAAREGAGAFKDLFDFCCRIDSTGVNKRAVEYLVKAGAFDRLTEAAADGVLEGRAAMLEGLETAIRYGNAAREREAQGQTSLFGDAVDVT